MTRLRRALLAEFFGTALLLAAVVGSGIMGERLAAGNAAVALLANAGATAAALYVLIVLFAPASGAHFNPAVTLALWWRRTIDARTAIGYVAVQIPAALAGVLLAHAMFAQPLLQPGTQARSGAGIWLGESVATAGLVLIVLIGGRRRLTALPALIACWVFAAYWFTSSTAFANPAVTIARSLTQTFAGIRAQDVAAFALAQLVGVALACALAPLMHADTAETV